MTPRRRSPRAARQASRCRAEARGNPLAARPARDAAACAARGDRAAAGDRRTDGDRAAAAGGGIEAAWRSGPARGEYGADAPLGPGGRAIEVSEGPRTCRCCRSRRRRCGCGLRRAPRPGGRAAPRGRAARTKPARADGLPEPAQPVFTRYWLHGKGPAPAGNVPVAVHFSPTRVTLAGGARRRRAPPANVPARSYRRGHGTRVTLTVACGPLGAAARSSSSCLTGSPPGRRGGRRGRAARL